MLTVTDLFCGAGGSSIGAESVPGVQLRMAANHWTIAVETHNSNFPGADHDCADITQVQPRRYPSTDILIASPECTNHSQAKTHKAVATLFDPHGADEAERSRATMMDVPRFAEHHRYKAIIVENVEEVRRWTGFEPWLQWMTNMGYDHEIVHLNSMIAWPTPQSRDRIYIVFWLKTQRRPDLRIEPKCWCATCEVTVDGRQSWKRPERPGGKYRQQYNYRCTTCGHVVFPLAYPASSAIDWTLPAERIGDRAKPLADATRRRIEIGLRKFGTSLVQTRGHTFERPGYARVWPVGVPSPTMTTEIAHGLAIPGMLVSTTYSGDPEGKPPRSPNDPFATQTGQRETGVAIAPFMVQRAQTTADKPSRVRPVDEPMPTMTTSDDYGVAIPPAFYLKNYGGIDEAQYRAHEISEPLGAITSAGDSHSVVTLPFMTTLRGGGTRERSTSMDAPLDTLTASGTHHGVVLPPAFYVKGYGDGTDESMAHLLSDPLGAVTAQDHHGVVQLPPAFTVDYHGNGSATLVVDPLPTQDTRDRHALVLPAPEITVDDCAFRMLAPHEIGAAMAFPTDYIMVGNKRQKVRLYGNAVTPPVMQLLISRVVASLS